MRPYGVWLTFFDPGEGAADRLPALGPFTQVLFSHDRLVVDRPEVRHDTEGDSRDGAQWIAAELELKRALGELMASKRKAITRLERPDGDELFLRFSNYAAGQLGTSEFGPFKAVEVRAKQVEASGVVLAIQTASRSWRLTEACGFFSGTEWPDLAVRDRAGSFRPLPQLASSPQPVRAPQQTGAPATRPAQAAAWRERPEEPHPDPRELEAHIRESQRAVGRALERVGAPLPSTSRVPGREVSLRRGGRGRRLSLSQLRVIVLWAVALSLAGGLVAWQTLAPRSTSPTAIVDPGTIVLAGQLEYRVGAVSRATALGSLRAAGLFVIVHVFVVSRDSGLTVRPSSFSLIDARQRTIAALSLDSPAYGTIVDQKPLTWPSSFPRDTEVEGMLIFDVDQGAMAGLQLRIPGANTVVRLTG